VVAKFISEGALSGGLQCGSFLALKLNFFNNFEAM